MLIFETTLTTFKFSDACLSEYIACKFSEFWIFPNDNAAMSTPSFTETVHAMLYRMAEYASYNLMEDAAMLAFIFS